jgi:hypothetical protein
MTVMRLFQGRSFGYGVNAAIYRMVAKREDTELWVLKKTRAVFRPSALWSSGVWRTFCPLEGQAGKPASHFI